MNTKVPLVVLSSNRFSNWLAVPVNVKTPVAVLANRDLSNWLDVPVNTNTPVAVSMIRTSAPATSSIFGATVGAKGIPIAAPFLDV